MERKSRATFPLAMRQTSLTENRRFLGHSEIDRCWIKCDITLIVITCHHQCICKYIYGVSTSGLLSKTSAIYGMFLYQLWNKPVQSPSSFDVVITSVQKSDRTPWLIQRRKTSGERMFPLFKVHHNNRSVNKLNMHNRITYFAENNLN